MAQRRYSVIICEMNECVTYMISFIIFFVFEIKLMIFLCNAVPTLIWGSREILRVKQADYVGLPYRWNPLYCPVETVGLQVSSINIPQGPLPEPPK